jgi:Flp pilus assembly protein TadD
LLILVVWGVCEVTWGWRYQALAMLVAGGAALGLCLTLSRQQISYWRDSETLFQHVLEVTEKNCIAHNSLGNALNRKGRIGEAIPHYEEAIRLKPDYAEAYNDLGSALDDRGQSDEAIHQYRVALQLKPDYADAYYNLGNALGRKGQTDEAIRSYQEALRLKPDYAEAHNNLGIAFYRQGRTADAIRQFEEALRLKPKFAGARKNLDAVLATKAQFLPAPGAATNR